MVTTGGPSAGGSGFEYGENTVAARLSIDIPTEGVQSLREITQEISRFRTEMEAASRSEGDFIGFFQTLPSIATQAANAFKTYADQLERGLSFQQRLSGAVGQWDVQPGSSPDNFKGMSAGMGRSSGEVPQQVAEMDRMREMGQAGERQYLNIHKQRGATQPGDIPLSNSANDIAAATERISARERVNQERIGGGDISSGSRIGQTGGIAREIMNEFSVGNGQGLPTQLLRRGINAAAAKAAGGSNNGGPHASGAVVTPDSGTSGAAPTGPDDGGGMGGLGGILGGLLGKIPGLGTVAGAAGLGLGAFQAAQFLGPKIQNLKDAGMVQGGGAKEGLEQEVNARIMAMSPFLSNDQSRSIIQSALRDGYSGKEYETVTKFMADNIKDFAMTVQESRDAVKKQMVEGGMTPESIAASLEQQKNLSKSGYLSFPDRKKALLQLGGQMSDMGVPGDIANMASGQALEMFSDSQMLKGIGADMLAAGTSDDLGTQGAMMAMMGITPSQDYSEWSTQIASAGSEGQEKLLRVLAKKSNGNIGVFRTMLQRLGGLPNITVAQAKELYKKAMEGGSFSAASARLDQQSGSAGPDSIERRSAASVLIGDLSGGISAAGGKFSDLVTGNWGNIEQRNRAADWQTEVDHIPILDKLVEYGGGDPNKLLVQDASGEWKKLQSGNKEQLETLSRGGKWKRADDTDSPGYTLAQAPGVMSSNFGKQDVQVNGQVQIHVSTDPGVKVSGGPVQTVTLTQNQMKANAGWGNATVNNPPPGDR